MSYTPIGLIAIAFVLGFFGGGVGYLLSGGHLGWTIGCAVVTPIASAFIAFLGAMVHFLFTFKM
jgi:hypothetical protein